MTPDTLRPAPDEEGVLMDDQTEVLRLQAEAARKTETIGAFRQQFHGMVQRAIEAGHIQDGVFAEKQTDAVNAVTKDHVDIRTDVTEAGVLGYNRIGAGRAGMRISKQSLADIRFAGEKNAMTQVVEHELAHGEQVQLHGELKVDDQTVDHHVLYEGHAEVRGNEGAGMGITDHRDGQPEALYAEGQNLAVRIIRKVGRAKFEEVMTRTGDLNTLAI